MATPQQVNEMQRRDAERDRAARAPSTPSATSTAVVPVAKAVPPAVAAPDGRTAVQHYLDDIAPASIVGRMIKFGRNGSSLPRTTGRLSARMSTSSPCAIRR